MSRQLRFAAVGAVALAVVALAGCDADSETTNTSAQRSTLVTYIIPPPDPGATPSFTTDVTFAADATTVWVALDRGYAPSTMTCDVGVGAEVSATFVPEGGGTSGVAYVSLPRASTSVECWFDEGGDRGFIARYFDEGEICGVREPAGSLPQSVATMPSSDRAHCFSGDYPDMFEPRGIELIGFVTVSDGTS